MNDLFYDIAKVLMTVDSAGQRVRARARHKLLCILHRRLETKWADAEAVENCFIFVARMSTLSQCALISLKISMDWGREGSIEP